MRAATRGSCTTTTRPSPIHPTGARRQPSRLLTDRLTERSYRSKRPRQTPGPLLFLRCDGEAHRAQHDLAAAPVEVEEPRVAVRPDAVRPVVRLQGEPLFEQVAGVITDVGVEDPIRALVAAQADLRQARLGGRDVEGDPAVVSRLGCAVHEDEAEAG